MAKGKRIKRETADCQFFQLRPKGVDLTQRKKTPISLSDIGVKDQKRLENIVKNLIKYRKDGLSKFHLDYDQHLDRYERYFLSKYNYLLSNAEPSNFSMDQLILLLGDRYTLFNHRAQSYVYTRKFLTPLVDKNWKPPQKQTLEQLEGLTDEQARKYAIAMKGSAVRVAAEKLTGRYTIERRLEEMEFYREEMEQAGWLPTELEQYQEDSARVTRLRELCKQYRSWENQGPFYLDNKQTAKSESISSDDIDRSTLNSIHRAAAEYFNRVNRNSNFDIAQTGTIFEDLVYELETMIDIDLTPYAFLMACVTQKFHFSVGGLVDVEACLRTYDNPALAYNDRPDKETQRLERVRFLNELIHALGLSDEAALKNWRLFLNSHGNRILSREENNLWKEIVEKTPGIVPIELQQFGMECLNACLPVRAEDLACYKSGSPLHIGGFFRYIKEHPAVIPALVQMLPRNSEYWGGKEAEHFRLLYRYDYDLDKVRNHCIALSKRAVIKWETIPGATIAEQQAFCKSLRNGLTEENVSQYVQELRSLLIEYAITEDAGMRIRLLLAQQFEHYFNPKNDEFGMTISPRWSTDSSEGNV